MYNNLIARLSKKANVLYVKGSTIDHAVYIATAGYKDEIRDEVLKVLTEKH